MQEISLYEDPDNLKPVWYEHPRLKKQIDIAVIPLPIKTLPLMYKPITSNWPADDVIPEAGMDIFILGFPLSIHANRLPIWKRGSIACEPTLLIDKVPKFYIDSATRSGMSGSPVFIVTSGGFSDSNGRFWLNSRKRYKFIGVYSGRCAPDPIPKNKEEDQHFRAQIGIVYRAQALTEIIKSIGLPADKNDG